MWVTQDGYFRVFATVFGMCVVDCWCAHKHQLSENHQHNNCELISFTNIMTKDLLENKESNVIDDDSLSLCIAVAPAREITASPSSGSRVPQLINKTSETSLEIRDLKISSQVESHKLVPCEDQTDAKRPGRNKRTGLAITKMRKRTHRGNYFE